MRGQGGGAGPEMPGQRLCGVLEGLAANGQVILLIRSAGQAFPNQRMVVHNKYAFLRGQNSLLLLHQIAPVGLP